MFHISKQRIIQRGNNFLFPALSLCRSRNKRYYYDDQNPLMTVYLILAISAGTSAAQPIVSEDSVNQGPLAIPQVVCPPDPTTVQQQFKECASTSDSKNSKKLGKRAISESTSEHGTQLLFCLWYNISIHEPYGRKNPNPMPGCTVVVSTSLKCRLDSTDLSSAD